MEKHKTGGSWKGWKLSQSLTAKAACDYQIGKSSYLYYRLSSYLYYRLVVNRQKIISHMNHIQKMLTIFQQLISPHNLEYVVINGFFGRTYLHGLETPTCLQLYT